MYLCDCNSEIGSLYQGLSYIINHWNAKIAKIIYCFSSHCVNTLPNMLVSMKANVIRSVFPHIFLKISENLGLVGMWNQCGMSKNNISEIQIENDMYRMIIKYYPDCSVDHGLVSIKPYCSNLSNFRWFLGFSSRQGLENLDECQTEIFLATYSADGVALKKET